MKNLVIASLLFAAPAFAADKMDKSAMGGADPMAAAMAKYATPGAEHKQLNEWLIGTWTTKSKMYMGDKVQESTGSAEFKPVLGGRFVEETYKSATPMGTFEGKGTTGYDIGNKKYVATWVDNMGTAVTNCEGGMDTTSKTLTEKCAIFDSMTGKPGTMKVVYKFEPTKHTATFFDMKDGKEVKSMEIVYTKTTK